MKIDEGVLSRLHEIIDDSALSRRQFALGIGHAPSTITEIFSRRIKTLSGSVTTILELKYGINPEWLATGAGLKYKDSVVISEHEEFELLKKFRRLKRGNKKMMLRFADTLHQQQSDDDDDDATPLQVADQPDEPYSGGASS